MKHSAPNRWLYGGILDRLEWAAGDATVRTWDGSVEAIRDGDTLVMLYTGALAPTFVSVEPQETETAA